MRTVAAMLSLAAAMSIWGCGAGAAGGDGDPKYVLHARFPSSPEVAVGTEVRIGGVDVGTVVESTLDEPTDETLITIEIFPEFAPISPDARAVRRKTLLGETYVELASASSLTPLEARLDSKKTVDIDDVYKSLDRPTRKAFQEWQRNARKLGER